MDNEQLFRIIKAIAKANARKVIQKANDEVPYHPMCNCEPILPGYLVFYDNDVNTCVALRKAIEASRPVEEDLLTIWN